MGITFIVTEIYIVPVTSLVRPICNTFCAGSIATDYF